MEKETLQYLTEFLNSTSPELWNAAINHIHAVAWQWSIWGVITCIYGILSIWADYKFELQDDINGVGYFIGVILFFISIICFVNAVGRFVGPEIYAINYLLNFNIL